MSVGQKQARTHLDRSVVEEHRVWRGKGPARAEATKTKAYRCSRLTVRYCSEKNISEILFKHSVHEKRLIQNSSKCVSIVFCLTPQPSSGYSPGASPGQRPWESWPEAVRVLARGRARGIFPGPNPSEPQVGVLARGGVRGKILLAGVC